MLATTISLLNTFPLFQIIYILKLSENRDRKYINENNYIVSALEEQPENSTVDAHYFLPVNSIFRFSQILSDSEPLPASDVGVLCFE